MPDRFGSHWRWRLAIGLVAVTLIGYGWWQARRWEWRRLVESGGTPVIYRTVHGDGSQSIEAFDWQNGGRWTITTIPPPKDRYKFDDTVIVTQGGKAIAWRDGGEIRVVDIDAPHRLRSYPLPDRVPGMKVDVQQFPSAQLEYSWFDHHRLVQVSPDDRFAILESGGGFFTNVAKMMRRRWWPDGWHSSVHLVVVDLQLGEVVSSRLWQSIMIEGEKAGEFESFCTAIPPDSTSDPVYGRWRLGDKGEWVLLEQKGEPPAKVVQIAEDYGGGIRLVDEANPTRVDEVVSQGTIARTLLDGILVEDSGRRKLRFFNLSMKQQGVVDRLNLRSAHVAADGQTIAGSNQYDDILVFDIASGTLMAREMSGSSRRLQLLAIGIALLCLVVVWVRVGMAESVLAWGVFDALAAIGLIQASIHPISASSDTILHLGYWSYFLIPAHLFQGRMVGVAVLAGWYLVHGRQWVAVRWLLGTLVLFAFIAPLLASKGWDVSLRFEMVLRIMCTLGLFISSAAAAVAVVFCPLGWSISPPGDRPGTWRFGLMPMLVLVASAGVATSLYQLLPFIPDENWFFWSVGAVVFGIPLVGALFLRSRWRVAIGVVVFLAIAGGAVFFRAQTFGKVGRWDFWADEAITTASAAVTILIPCLVVRGHGWKWTRTSSFEASRDQPATNLAEAA